MNNPNVVGPYGTQTVTWQGDTPTLSQNLSPQQQLLLNESNATKIRLSQLAGQGANAAGQVIGKNLDLSGLPAQPGNATDTRTKVLDAMMTRVNEDSDRQRGLTESRLLASGIPRGSKAYDDAMALQERTRTDAANQAYLASGQEMTRDFQQDAQRRREALGELLAQRQTPLNEITALMSGSQVSNPFSVPGYAQNAQVQAAPLFQAQQLQGDWASDLYNARAAQAGNLQQGLFGLGAAGIGAYGASDRRLKRNIVKIGMHPVGVPLYEYDIDGRHEQGVMADELEAVRPDAVFVGSDGYQRVRYDLIGGRDAVHLHP
jgi:hypothetical protein